MNWNYVTLHFYHEGTIYYQTDVQRYFESEERVYTLMFFDVSNDTLNQLDSWGTTFTG